MSPTPRGASPFLVLASNLGWALCILMMLATGGFLWIFPGVLLVPLFSHWLEQAFLLGAERGGGPD